MSMSTKMKQKRKELSQLSAPVMQAVRNGMFATINEGLINIYKEDTGASRFDTVKQWNEKGFHITKGESAFLIWGSPLSKPVDKEIKEDEESSKFKFFPICHLFSDLQVSEYKAKR